MKFSYNWLKEIAKVNISPEKMADDLMMHSFEVESIEKKGADLENIVVGKILEIKKHPNADKLQLTKVDIGPSLSISLPKGERGKKNNIIQIVCGASNIKVADMVPVALVGAKLPGGMEIKEAEIRGVKSFGMLCAEDELELGKNHGGILILEKYAKVGKKLAEELELEDATFEVKVLPDRGHDALCHIGMAREVAALNNKKLSSPVRSLMKRQTDKLKIEIKDKEFCPRYIGAVLDNIKIQDSPARVKQRLLSLGINPINNVVDATNYVMMEFGQPLHAFDLKKITPAGGKQTNIIIRKAKENEEIKLLDGTIKKLSAEDLVIANENKALALAGIMGGEDSGINENTTSIVLEAANFNAANIRRSRTRLNLKTEASDRYEKGIDPNLCETAMARVIEIIKSFGAEVEGIVDNYPSTIKPWQIKLNLDYVNKLLGEKVSSKETVKILNLLNLETFGTGKIITVKIPTIRIDLQTQEDLIEEIGRIYGYEKIKSQAPIVSIQAAKTNERVEFEKSVKNILVSNGFSEVYNYSFYSSKAAEDSNMSEVKHLELENPMNPEQALLRTSLIPGILKDIKENLKNFNELSLFEIGKIYYSKEKEFPEEKNMLVGALVLEKDKKAETFYRMKGYANALFEKLGITSYYFDNFECLPEDSTAGLWHEIRCANIKTSEKNEDFGHLGEINPIVLKDFGIDKRVAMFEFDFKKLQEISNTEREFMPLRKYPVSTRDISLIAPSDIRTDDILKNIQQSGGNLVLNTELFDIFDFEEKNETSFTFRITFASDSGTLKNEEVEELMKKIINSLEKDLGVKIRK